MQKLFWRACREGRTVDVLKYLEDPRVDPMGGKNHAMFLAGLYGCADVMRVLLAHHRVDPARGGRIILRLTVQGDRAQVLRVMLADGRVDACSALPFARDECLHVIASHNRYSIEGNRALYVKHHPDLVRRHDLAIAQGLTMAFVASQQRPWESLVEPVAKRLKAGCF